MDKSIIRKDEFIQNNITFDNITRCPNCNLISALKLFYQYNKPIINYYCENNHNGNISLEEYLQKYNNHSLLKQKCEECNKNQNEIKGDYFYCCKCNKFICISCIINHSNNEKHNIISFKRYDSFCKIHSHFFSFYCLNVKKIYVYIVNLNINHMI